MEGDEKVSPLHQSHYVWYPGDQVVQGFGQHLQWRTFCLFCLTEPVDVLFFIFIKGFRVKVACRARVQLMPVIICILHFYRVPFSASEPLSRCTDTSEHDTWNSARHFWILCTFEFQHAIKASVARQPGQQLSERSPALLSLITVPQSYTNHDAPSVPSSLYLNIKQPE